MEDENINKAKKVLETISQDERERRLTELREKIQNGSTRNNVGWI